MIKAIIFDMDGVITDTMPYHFKAWRRALEANGIPNLDPCAIYCREGQRGIQTVKEISAFYGLKFSSAVCKRILQQKETSFRRIAKQKLFPWARTLLKSLKEKGYRLALVTGTARKELNKILTNEVQGLFDFIITGSEVKFGKPHPEPYLMALKALKIKPNEAIVIENAPLGITSAKRAKIRTIAISSYLSKAHLSEADVILPDLKAVKAYIK